MQATGSVVTTGWGVVFRYRDAGDYWRVSAVPAFGTFNIFKVVGGVDTRVGSTQLTSFGSTSTVGIRLRPRAFTVFVDGFETVTIHDDAMADGRRAGLSIDSTKATGARFSGFAAGPPDDAGARG